MGVGSFSVFLVSLAVTAWRTFSARFIVTEVVSVVALLLLSVAFTAAAATLLLASFVVAALLVLATATAAVAHLIADADA